MYLKSIVILSVYIQSMDGASDINDISDNKKIIDNFSNNLENTDSDGIIKMLCDLEKSWTLNPSNMIPDILKNYEIANLGDVDYSIIEEKKDIIMFKITGIQMTFMKFHDINTEEYNNRWNKILETVYYSDKFLKANYILHRLSNNDYDEYINDDSDGLFKFTPIDTVKNTAYQNLLLFIMGKINELDYAKYNESLYEKIYYNGNFTYSWKKVSTIKEFIMKSCNVQTNYEQWKNSTVGGNQNIKSAEQYIIEFKGNGIKTIIKDRHVHSFRNGVYISKYLITVDEEKKWTDVFIPYGQKNDILTPTTAASKYFDQDFNNYDDVIPENFFDIIKDCPVFKSIMDYQKFSKDVQKWLVIFIGRNLFNINEIEKWSVIMYLLGMAGAGKSTIIEKIIAKFYDPDDIKMMSNNIEKKFGIKPLAAAKIVIAPEIQADCSLEQTEWQLISEGGTITPAEKNKSAETITWLPPVPMAGNNVPAYKNNCGQQSRRTVIWKFWRKVIDTNTHLEEELYNEIPNIIKMSVMGYIYTVNKYKKKGIWKILPKYFQENQEEMDENTNTLLNFLKSSGVILSEKAYMPEKVFKQAFNEHCRENNLAKTQFTSDFYSTPFSNNGIMVAKKVRKKYPIGSDNYIHGTFFLGVDIVNGLEDYDDDKGPIIPE